MLSRRLRRAPDEVLGGLLRRLRDDPTTEWNPAILESLSGAELEAFDALSSVTKIEMTELTTSEDARSRAMHLLVTELIDRVATTPRGQHARSRLAARMELPLSQYRITISEQWLSWRDRQLTHGLLENVVREADALQWIPFRDVATMPRAMLLAAKRVNIGTSRIMVLVHAERFDARLHVVGALRVPNFLTDTLSDRTPLGLLRDFARAYAVPFAGRFANSGGLIIDEFIPLQGSGTQPGRLLEWRQPRERRAEIAGVTSMTRLKTGGLFVAYSYAVNLTRYRGDRRAFPED